MPYEKNENGIVARSEESITLMTSYRFPQHSSRSFAHVPDDVLPLVTFLSADKKGHP